MTDLNLLTGRLPASALPFEIDKNAASDALQNLLRQASSSAEEQEIADGLRRIANEQMASAVRAITIAQGLEPSEHTLVGFGGAAGQHICQIAELLNIETIIDPPDAGVLSAVGMGLASIARSASRSIYKGASVCSNQEINGEFEQLSQRLIQDMLVEQVSTANIQFDRTVEVRTIGTDRTLAIKWTSIEDLASSFHELHQQRYGYARPDLELEIATLRLIGKVPSDARWDCPGPSQLNQLASLDPRSSIDSKHKTAANHKIYSGGRWLPCSVYARDELNAGDVLVGPVIVLSNSHTMVVEDKWIALVCDDGSIAAKKLAVEAEKLQTEVAELKTGSQELFREIIAQRFAAIAGHMGIVLEQTAISVNIRDRRDFSCAIFDQHGSLIANAPHVPVHLGAMQATVQAALRMFPKMEPGDSFITNDPFCGGSHLPDITVITPVFVSGTTQLAFFVANRAHHAEIGGIAPGSMAPTATRLVQEGVIIEMQHLAKAGRDCSGAILNLLTQGPHPSRLPGQNMSDLSAQSAANQRGVSALQELVKEVGWDRLSSITEAVLKITETKVRNWILSKSPLASSFCDKLDDGTPIEVRLKFHDDRLTIDFTGTGGVSPRNFNASIGIVQAAVLYVIRVLLSDSMPMNNGALRPIELVVPPGILNPQLSPNIEERPAVAAGNVETSQRLVDVLLGAMGVCGASQGTMNNFLMGNREFGFYETIGGGTGATKDSDGADAIHSHMTNTRLTDPEILEQRYPVRLRRWQIRQGSGGQGTKKGGNGMIREIEFLVPVDVSLITSRRSPYAAYGMAGGENGLSGQNWFLPANGEAISLPSCVQITAKAGDRLRIETPGGGGFGTPK